MEHMQTISAFDDPTLASEAARSLLDNGDRREDDAPVVIDQPPDCSVTLPGGLVTVTNDVITDAEVRELTGADEEALSKADAMRNPARYVQTILGRAVVRIGDHEPPNKDVLSALLIGDRNMLLLGIRRATYGPTMDLSVDCPACEEGLDIEVDLHNDIPIRTMEDPTQRTFTVELRKGRQARVSLPCGGDQDAVLADGKRTVSEMNTLMLSRCVQEIDGQPVMGPAAVRNLGLADRRAILDFLADTQPGPRLEEVSEECPSCGRNVPVPIDLFGLFRT